MEGSCHMTMTLTWAVGQKILIEYKPCCHRGLSGGEIVCGKEGRLCPLRSTLARVRRLELICFIEGLPFWWVSCFQISPHCLSRKDEEIGDMYERPDELIPFRTGKFCGVDVPIPNFAETYLDRAYPKWRTECVVFAHHDNFSINNVWRVTLEEYNERVRILEADGDKK